MLLLRRLWRYAPFLAALGLLLADPIYRDFVLRNLLLQSVWFLAAAQLPAWRTGRMSYVDIAWPWGLVLIGVQTLLYAPGFSHRVWLIGALYLVAGARMGIGALLLWRHGELDRELPRYQYQRLRWAAGGYKSEKLSLQYETYLQCLANASILLVPALLCGFNKSPHLEVIEYAGLALWCIFFTLEHVADLQKQQYLLLRRRKLTDKAFCDLGLWRYSRHPNYFFEWMVWNSLILLSLHTFVVRIEWPAQPVVLATWVGLGALLLGVSGLMFHTLVHYTGAEPAEYYSAQKRAGYREYQQRTRMFFPWPARDRASP